jgi:hypothetical protein
VTLLFELFEHNERRQDWRGVMILRIILPSPEQQTHRLPHHRGSGHANLVRWKNGSAQGAIELCVRVQTFQFFETSEPKFISSTSTLRGTNEFTAQTSRENLFLGPCPGDAQCEQEDQ